MKQTNQGKRVSQIRDSHVFIQITGAAVLAVLIYCGFRANFS